MRKHPQVTVALAERASGAWLVAQVAHEQRQQGVAEPEISAWYAAARKQPQGLRGLVGDWVTVREVASKGRAARGGARGE